MRALDIKLLRDLMRLWPQALAIALVMAAGVATLILGVGAHDSLATTRARYYEANRFADVFATAHPGARDRRKPRSRRSTAWPRSTPASRRSRWPTSRTWRSRPRCCSCRCPDYREPTLNRIYLRSGQAARPRGRRRGRGQRRLRQGPWTDGRSDHPCADQWPAARRCGSRHGAVARIHLCAGARRPDAG